MAGTLYFTEQGGARLRSVVGGRYAPVAAIPAAGAGLALGPYGLALALPSGHQVELFGACGYSPWAAAMFPVCALSQLKGLQSGGLGKSTPTPGPGGRRGWKPALGPSPARASAPLSLAFQETVAEGQVDIYDLGGRLIRTVEIHGAARLDMAAPASPGIYLVWIQAKTALGGSYEQTLKLAVLP